MAGLWSAWRDRAEGPDADLLHSATVVTTAANGTMSPIHDRMPVILERRAEPLWIDRGTPFDKVSGLLVPYEAQPLRAEEETPHPAGQPDLFSSG